MKYWQLLKKYDLFDHIICIINSKTEFPLFTVELPPDLSYGFPPGFIPLFSDEGWPGYTGIVVDVFNDNSLCYCEFYSEEFQCVEVARNIEQLKAWLVFSFYYTVPDYDEIEAFSKSICFCEPGNVEKYFKNIYKKQDLKKLNVFKNDLPKKFHNSPNSIGDPVWSSQIDSMNDIHQLISAGLLNEAWFALNSSNYCKSETLEVLNKFSSHIIQNKEFFNDLISCWKVANT